MNHSAQFWWDGGYTLPAIHKWKKKELGRGDNFENLRGDAYSSMLRRVQVVSNAYSSHVLPESGYSQLLSIQTRIWNKCGENWK